MQNAARITQPAKRRRAEFTGDDAGNNSDADKSPQY